MSAPSISSLRHVLYCLASAFPLMLGFGTGLDVSGTEKLSEGKSPRPELTSCFCWDTFWNVDDCINICSKFPLNFLKNVSICSFTTKEGSMIQQINNST